MSDTDNFAQKRRQEIRLYGLYPLLARVKNFEGQHIKMHTVADNLSCGGMYFQLPHPLIPGIRIFALIQLPKDLRMAIRGRVLRNEPKPGGMAGNAICFSHTRIIRLSSQ